MIQVLSSADPTVIAAAQARLRAEAIESFVLDVHTSAVFGAALAFVPQRLMVIDEDAPRARVILWREGLKEAGEA